MKYIIIKGYPVLFSSEMNHAFLADKAEDIEGAGFFTITKSKEKQKLEVVCLGESVSLSVRSRPEIDQKIIADFLKLEQ